MTTITASAAPRLLSGRLSGHTPLEAHIAVHGAAPLGHPGDPRWAARHAGEIEASGLNGRGGAGFAAWRKLESLRRAGGSPVVVVNAMEGEPASAKDRVLLAYAPHLVLDGAQLTASAINAGRVVVCVADDQPSAAESVLRAVGERRSRRLDPVATDVLRPPGHFVAGEESALAAWLDGRDGKPAFRTDKSIPLRAKRRPLLVHNAETLAHISLISRYGASWFRQVGTPGSPGTTLVTISGAVAHPGVLEVQMGTPLCDIIDEAMPAGRPPAVIVGGYGGSFVGSADLEVGFSREQLATVGASPGAGVIAVLAPGSCGVAESARVARYLARQSAGQCGPCVFGLPAIASSLEQVWRAEVSPDSDASLRRRIGQVTGRGACRHPDGATRLVSSALRVFADDFAEHAAGRPCAGANRPSVLAFAERSARDLR
ncbi:MAG: NADH-ubiquinone oxidoreductase-F iron-sulfur binding region domain-containing protein [Acidimicrobiales bacterium]